ncbi:MAG: hypothetical protein Ta2D_10360 [Rickettsiales bacterium]|nr:MAG: hypothetical protein Ta2D_10360 [Rickettsiales bacterium]
MNIKSIKDFLNAEREIVYISNSCIKSKKITIGFLVWNLLFVFWVAFSTIMYFHLTIKYLQKDEENLELLLQQSSLNSRIYTLKKEVSNVSAFLNVLNKYDRYKSVKIPDFNKDEDLTLDDNAMLVLDRSEKLMKNVVNNIADRTININKIKNVIISTSNKLQFVALEKNTYPDYISPELANSIVLKKELYSNLENLKEMENYINDLPLSKPINYIRLTSHFGARNDPLLKTQKFHKGVDLAGAYFSKIYAPADGVIVFTGIKSGYGNTIIIEHKNNIKTYYAHLSKINVKNGQAVKRNDIIGIQGNTGRSTGDHLHYEVINEKGDTIKIIDPIKLIEMGEGIF